MFVVRVEAGVGLRAGSCYDEEFKERIGLERDSPVNVKGEGGIKVENKIEMEIKKNIGRVMKVLEFTLGEKKRGHTTRTERRNTVSFGRLEQKRKQRTIKLDIH